MDSFKKLYAGQCLYAVLNVDKAADAAQIKKAYFKKALQWHPDKNADDPTATQRFQALSWAHSLLGDAGKRKVYDETGSFEEAEAGAESESFDVWYGYWRDMFPAVTKAAIAQFEATYRGGAEEAADVLAAFDQAEGDLDEVLDGVMCARPEDEDRFVAIIQQGIAAGKVPAHEAFVSLYGSGGGRAPSKRGASAAARAKRARAERATGEAAEADAMLADMKRAHVKKGGKQGDSLEDMLRARQAERARASGSLLDDLARRYGGGAALLDDGDDEDGGGGGGGGSGGRKAKRKAPAAAAAAAAAAAPDGAAAAGKQRTKAKK